MHVPRGFSSKNASFGRLCLRLKRSEPMLVTHWNNHITLHHVLRQTVSISIYSCFEELGCGGEFFKDKEQWQWTKTWKDPTGQVGLCWNCDAVIRSEWIALCPCIAGDNTSIVLEGLISCVETQLLSIPITKTRNRDTKGHGTSNISFLPHLRDTCIVDTL